MAAPINLKVNDMTSVSSLVCRRFDEANITARPVVHYFLNILLEHFVEK